MFYGIESRISGKTQEEAGGKERDKAGGCETDITDSRFPTLKRQGVKINK